jgi:hypothetical protein
MAERERRRKGKMDRMSQIWDEVGFTDVLVSPSASVSPCLS